MLGWSVFLQGCEGGGALAQSPVFVTEKWHQSEEAFCGWNPFSLRWMESEDLGPTACFYSVVSSHVCYMNSGEADSELPTWEVNRGVVIRSDCSPSPASPGNDASLSPFLSHTQGSSWLLLFSPRVMSNSCNPTDCSPPGFTVYGISQARILEWDCHFLLQGIFLTPELSPYFLH